MGIRHVQIDSSGTVQAVVIWDGVMAYDPSPDTLVASDTAQKGDTYDGTAFTPGPPPPFDPNNP